MNILFYGIMIGVSVPVWWPLLKANPVECGLAVAFIAVPLLVLS